MTTYLISYDISNNKLRKKVSDKLIYYGMYRMQYSVFVGSMQNTLYTHAIAWLTPLIQGDDKLMVIKLSPTSAEKMLLLGKQSVSLTEITAQINTLYIS